jgi:isopentenyl-diphosphate delta-isomerase type 1
VHRIRQKCILENLKIIYKEKNKEKKYMEEKFDVLNELGEFTGEVATREECHKEGLWHRAVYAFIIDKQGNILLQRRSANKKLWPNMWDVTVGGHVDSGEFGRQALIRETKEELGIEINDNDIKYLVGSTSINKQGDIINKHYNECYLITKNIDISEIKIQKEEVSEVRYFSKYELLRRISNNYEGLTEKTGPWNFLKKILDRYV